jgi:hypothetical protein
MMQVITIVIIIVFVATSGIFIFSGSQSRNILLPSDDSLRGALALNCNQIASIEPISIALAAESKPLKTKD